MKEEKSEITINFKITLPFWVEFENNSIFEKEYNERKYVIELKQDFWQVNFRSNFKSASFLMAEEGVIDRNFMRPKINFDDMKIVDLTQEKEFDEKWYYTSTKVKTILILNTEIPYIDNNDDILKYIDKYRNI